MKTLTTIRFLTSLLAVNAGVLWGAPTAANPVGTALPAPTPYAVVSRDAHSRVWERTVYERGPSGQAIPSKHRYVELATGLNFWDSTAKQWQESQELIESFPGGAIARHGQHQVIFANNLATAGAIDMQTPDGKRLRSHVLGLSYFDTASGQSVLIAEVKDSQGQLYPPNVVIFPDAFTDFKADVRYTYTRAGFEQDIILHERPPGPEAYGLNPASTRLQVLTEFLNPPTPVTRQTSLMTRQGDALDEDLDFGVMKMGRGKAFSLERGGEDIPVSKQWLKLEGRDFLVEEVAVPDIDEELQALPAAEGASLNPAAGSVRHVVSKQRRLPTMPLVQAGTNKMQLARLSLPSQGLVLDYTTLNSSQTNYTFQGDTTYYISGGVYLYSTTIFEGGTVVKYLENSGSLALYGPFTCLTAAYRPAIFTSMNDNSVGETISGSSGNPGLSFPNYINSAYYYYDSSTISLYKHMRFLYGGVYDGNGAIFDNRFSVEDVQFVNCGWAINCGTGSVADPNVTDVFLKNVLFVNCGLCVAPDGGPGIPCVVRGTQMTVENCQQFAGGDQADCGASYALITNSIFADCPIYVPAMFGEHNGFYNSTEFGANAVTNTFYPFQSAGAGNYYLTNGGSFFNQGTTNIDPTLLADLKKKTTWPPVVCSNWTITTNLTLAARAQLDTNDSPTLGYHYDPLDYLCSCIIRSNGVVLLTNGVSVGLFGNSGFLFPDGAGAFVSQGRPNAMNHLVWYPAVQEQPVKIGGVAIANSPMFELDTFFQATSALQFRFTDIAMQGIRQSLLQARIEVYDFAVLSFKDCWLRGVNLTVGANTDQDYAPIPAVTLLNNRLERSTVDLLNGMYSGQDYPLSLSAWNNLFWNSSFTLRYFDPLNPIYSPHWDIKDNLFDGSVLSFTYSSDYTNYVNISNNGYCNTTNVFGGVTNVTVTDLTYATGPLDSWYIGSALPTLTDKGSRGADSAGLYHYTMSTNLVNGMEVKETNSIVDIGYHYVAVDQYGNPLDSNGDGIPDYLEDANGNGLVDNGEPPWNTLPPPTILVSPQSATAIRGASTNFTVTVSGVGPLNYQWFQNGLPLTNEGTHIIGSTNLTLTLSGIRDTDSTFYQVVVSNPGGSTASSLATLTVLDPPVITTQPQNQTVNAGQNATFNVAAAGAVPMSCQWYSNSVALPNQTNTTLIFNPAQTNNAATNYHVIVTNVAGSATSSVASLTVLLPPASWLQTYFGTNWQNNPNAVTNADPDGDGTNNLQEYLNGTSPTDYYNGTLPNLSIISGTNQSGPLNAFLPVPLKIRATKSGGAPLTNAPVTFSVTNGLNELATSTNGGIASSLALQTDTSGYATVWLFLPLNAPVTNIVTVTAQSGINSIQVSFTCLGNAVATPVITPNGGTFATMQNVTVSCTTTGAVMHYTLNGSLPTETDSIVTNGQVIVIPGSATMNVDAFEDGVLFPSTIAMANFNITGAIAAGTYHTLAVKYDGSTWAAGTNNNGQLGDGTTNTRTTFVNVSNLTSGVIAVDCGTNFSLALLSNGTVRAWGLNSNGQLGDGTTVSQRATNIMVTNLTTVIAISAGGAHGLALLSNSTVRAWGLNSSGQLGDGTTTSPRLTTVIVKSLTNVIAISAGGLHSLALSNGCVRAWGLNSSGQLGDGTTVSYRNTNIMVTNLTSVIAIAAGGAHSLALLSNSTVRAWGLNSSGQLGDGTTTQRKTNVVVTGLSNVVAIAAGAAHSLALSNGYVLAWGTNNFGQLGDGTTNKSRLTSVLVIGLSNVVAIAAGSMHSVALKSDGTVWVWGLTNYGLPGGFSSTPVLVQPTNRLIYWAAPSIVTPPKSQTNVVGQNVTFSVIAAGTQPLSYQWYSNNLVVASATNACLTLTNVSTGAAGSFSVVITNFLGSVTSAVATLTVNMPSSATIISQPTNLIVAAGSTATFSVVAIDANQPLYYQWYTNVGGWIVNATNSTLVLSNVKTNQAGPYWVAVYSSGYDDTDSVIATLTVIVPPSIITQPTNQTVPLGNAAIFNVSASGAPPLSYQWFFGSTPINGATNTTLLLYNIQPSNLGVYCVVVTNIIGSITSSVVTLATNLPVSVAPPAGLVNWWPAEGNARDIVGGMNGTLYGNGASYAIGKVGQAFHFDGSYGLVSFGNNAGNFGTNDFTIEFWLRTTAGPFGEYPVIEKLPACGSTNEFTIRLEGQGFNNPKPGTLMADLGQSTNSRVSIQSTRTVNDGLFHYITLVRQATNLSLYIDGIFEVGGSTTNVVNLSNLANLMAASGPCIGSDNNYSWYFAGDLDEVSIYNRGLLPAEIQAIYNAAGAGKSTTAPYLITQPTNQQVFVGSSVTFSVTAGGNVPLSYQWYGFNTGLLANATNATLSLNNLQANQTDNYFVVVSNNVGSTASAAATLTVLDPATYDINGLPIAWEYQYFRHTSVNLNADPDGDGWSNWQEYQNGTNPTNADQPFLILITQPWAGSIIP